MEREITKKQNLLTEEGYLKEPGYSKRHLQVYNRNGIKSSSLRIKEWDYYYIGNNDFGVALTIADNSYMGLDGVSFLDFNKLFHHTKNIIKPLTMGKKKFPSSTLYGNVHSKSEKHFISFEHRGDHRFLSFYFDNFYKGLPIEGELKLANPESDSIVMATPFKEDSKAFYYNEKINCLPAAGIIRFDGIDYLFEPSHSFGVLDWGRGVWTYKNTWFWASASGLVDNIPFGFNLGYGFGETSAATENIIFYDGVGHKISTVKFGIPSLPGQSQREKKIKGEDFMSTWYFTSIDKRLELTFEPILDRAVKTDLKILKSDQHQVFGKYNGTVILDNGKALEIKDFMGFAEKVYNKW